MPFGIRGNNAMLAEIHEEEVRVVFPTWGTSHSSTLN
jgi:hypothetical protein